MKGISTLLFSGILAMAVLSCGKDSSSSGSATGEGKLVPLVSVASPAASSSSSTASFWKMRNVLEAGTFALYRVLGWLGFRIERNTLAAGEKFEPGNFKK